MAARRLGRGGAASRGGGTAPADSRRARAARRRAASRGAPRRRAASRPFRPVSLDVLRCDSSGRLAQGGERACRAQPSPAPLSSRARFVKRVANTCPRRGSSFSGARAGACDSPQTPSLVFARGSRSFGLAGVPLPLASGSLNMLSASTIGARVCRRAPALRGANTPLRGSRSGTSCVLRPVVARGNSRSRGASGRSRSRAPRNGARRGVPEASVAETLASARCQHPSRHPVHNSMSAWYLPRGFEARISALPPRRAVGSDGRGASPPGAAGRAGEGKRPGLRKEHRSLSPRPGSVARP